MNELFRDEHPERVRHEDGVRQPPGSQRTHILSCEPEAQGGLGESTEDEEDARTIGK